MEFLGLLFQVVFIAFGLALVVYLLYYTAWGIGIGLLVTLFTGWIPILACATDPDWNIRWMDGNLLENWAFIAMWEYIVVAIWTAIVAFVRPDPDGLPPGLKFLSTFYSVPGILPARQAARSGMKADLESIGDALLSQGIVTGITRKIQKWKYRKVAKELSEEAAYREAKVEFARKATEMERARVKMEEAEKRRKNT